MSTPKVHVETHTTAYISLDDDEVVVPSIPVDYIDPFLSEDGRTLRYAWDSNFGDDFEWSDVEFVQGNPRYNHYVSDGDEWVERVSETHDVFIADVYEHGNIMYSLSGEGVDCYFDTARGGAAIAIPRDHIDTREDTRVAAASWLKEYTSWCNGEVYGVQEMYLNDEGHWIEGDSCCGYIGTEFVESVLKEGL